MLAFLSHARFVVVCSERKVESFVDAVVAANSLAGVTAIIEQTHDDEDGDSEQTLSLARAISARGRSGVSNGLLLVGDADMLSPSNAARALADEGGWEFEQIAGAGHAVPIERPLVWRKVVLDFLNRSDGSRVNRNEG
jgi:pimeloyl-ACP methyl ester carboxylesterase|eukprot:COSAG02_NODE_4663_length_5118_cov_1.862921_2_plen_138_part_00